MFKPIKRAEFTRYAINTINEHELPGKDGYSAKGQYDPAENEGRPVGICQSHRASFEEFCQRGLKQLLSEKPAEIIDMEIVRPKNSPEECRRQGKTYGATLKVAFKLDGKTETCSISPAKFALPYLTEANTFIIYGKDKVYINLLRQKKKAPVAENKAEAKTTPVPENKVEAKTTPEPKNDGEALTEKQIITLGKALEDAFRRALRYFYNTLKKNANKKYEIKDCEELLVTTLREHVTPLFRRNDYLQPVDLRNPLALASQFTTITNMGKGGLTDRATFEQRDINNSYINRLCPIETPEGKNCGLIHHLSCYAKIEEDMPKLASSSTMTEASSVTDASGQEEETASKATDASGQEETASKIIPKTYTIKVPYMNIKTGMVEYISPQEEKDICIASARDKEMVLPQQKLLRQTKVLAKRGGKLEEVDLSQVTHLDIATDQLLSCSASLIPFLEHDDGHRALMAANMQKQAVHLDKPEIPIIGTGREYRIAQEMAALNLFTANPSDNSEASPSTRQEKLQGPCMDRGELALGKNLLVAYMPWYGYNYEDAIVISDELVQEDILSSTHLHTFSCRLESRKPSAGQENQQESFRDAFKKVVPRAETSHLDERGIIKPGTKVKPGMLLVANLVSESSTSYTPITFSIFGKPQYFDASLYAEEDTYGVVSSLQYFNGEGLSTDNPEEAETITVILEQKRTIALGDKLAGRHGNKGVVARIEPKEAMPYILHEDGSREHMQVLLNPLGVPSRMNLGQLYEAHLGWAARELGKKIKENKISLQDLEGLFEELPQVERVGKYDTVLFAAPAFNGPSLETIQDLYRRTGLADNCKTTLYNPQTNEPYENPVTVGIAYMLKLDHLVEDKLHARSTGKYAQITQQPLQGRSNDGGQRLGEMELWALEAHGAKQNLLESITIKSDDVEGREAAEALLRKGEAITQYGMPEGLKYLIKQLQALCFEVILKDDKDQIEIGLAEASTIENWAYKQSPEFKKHGEPWAHGEITENNYRKKEAYSINSQQIFGPKEDYRCACSNNALFRRNARKLVKEGTVCSKCGVAFTKSSLRRERMGYISLAVPVAHPLYIDTIAKLIGIKAAELKKVLAYKGYLKITKTCGQKVNQESMGTLEETGVLEKASDYKAELASITDYLDWKKTPTAGVEIGTGGEIIATLLSPENQRLLVKNLPVLPPALRPDAQVDNMLYINPLNEVYASIVSINESIKKHPDNPLTNLDKAKLQEYINILFVGGSAKLENLKDFIALMPGLAGKKGVFRNKLLGKRVNYSGRSVIMADPKLNFNYCGLPKRMALELFRPFIVRKMLEADKTLQPAQAEEEILHALEQAHALKVEQPSSELPGYKAFMALKEILKGEKRPVVLLNRTPTLHKLNLLAFYPVLVDDMAVHLHPLVCAGFNADFDGDTMAVHLPLSQEAQAEAEEKMLASRNMLSPCDGKLLAVPTQDMVLGLYYEKLQDQKLPNEKPPTKDSLAKDLDEKYRSDNPIITAKTLDRLKEKGYRIASEAGLSIAATDFPQPTAEFKRSLLEKRSQEAPKFTSKAAKEFIEVWCNTAKELYDVAMGEGSITPAMDEAGKSAVKLPEAKAEAASSGKSAAAPCNPFRVIVASGARGNEEQFKQICAMRGLFKDTNQEIIPLPVKSSLLEGLPDMEYFITCHGTRKGLTDTAIITGKAGYLTRNLVYALQEVKITAEDCGAEEEPRSVLTCKCQDGVCQKCYGYNPATRLPVELGTPVGILAANSLSEPTTQFVLRTFHNGGSASTKDITDSLPKLEAYFNNKRALELQEKLDKLGKEEFQQWLFDEIKAIYEANKVNIKDVHLKLIIRQMVKKVEAAEVGAAVKEGTPDGTIAAAKAAKDNYIIRSIRECALDSPGFLKAASFQQTGAILKEAALERKKDTLDTMAAQVMLGRVIR